MTARKKQNALTSEKLMKTVEGRKFILRQLSEAEGRRRSLPKKHWQKIYQRMLKDYPYFIKLGKPEILI